MNADTKVPLRVEASVGIYQAFDVGGGELLPTANGATPTTQGAATSRPSVSAANAPAKNSEQPS
jgi:hypothetical protein